MKRLRDIASSQTLIRAVHTPMNAKNKKYSGVDALEKNPDCAGGALRSMCGRSITLKMSRSKAATQLVPFKGQVWFTVALVWFQIESVSALLLKRWVAM